MLKSHRPRCYPVDDDDDDDDDDDGAEKGQSRVSQRVE